MTKSNIVFLPTHKRPKQTAQDILARIITLDTEEWEKLVDACYYAQKDCIYGIHTIAERGAIYQALLNGSLYLKK